MLVFKWQGARHLKETFVVKVSIRVAGGTTPEGAFVVKVSIRVAGGTTPEGDFCCEG